MPLIFDDQSLSLHLGSVYKISTFLQVRAGVDHQLVEHDGDGNWVQCWAEIKQLIVAVKLSVTRSVFFLALKLGGRRFFGAFGTVLYKMITRLHPQGKGGPKDRLRRNHSNFLANVSARHNYSGERREWASGTFGLSSIK